MISGDARRGLQRLSLPKMSLNPPSWNILVRNQEVNCAKILKFRSFLRWKPVDNVCRLLELLRVLSQNPYRGFAPRPSWETSVFQTPWTVAPQTKFLAPPLKMTVLVWSSCIALLRYVEFVFFGYCATVVSVVWWRFGLVVTSCSMKLLYAEPG